MREVEITYRWIDELFRHQTVRTLLFLLLVKFKSEIAVGKKGGEYANAKSAIGILMVECDCIVEGRYRFRCNFQINGPDEDLVEKALLSFQDINEKGINEWGYDTTFSRDFYELLAKTHPNHEYLGTVRRIADIR